MASPTATKDFNTIYVNDTDGKVSGNLLANDIAAGGDTLQLNYLKGAIVADTGKFANNTVKGEYGTFTVYSDGSYTYQLDLTNPAVANLASGTKLVESVKYKMSNGRGETATSSLSIDIYGPNIKPDAKVDNYSLSTPSHDNHITGNVLQNDTAGESFQTIQVARAGHGNLQYVPSDKVTSIDVEGVYGTLHIKGNGDFTYEVNTSDPDYIALGAGHSAVETFQYRIMDSAFGSVPNANSTDVDYIHISITNDTPLV